MPLKVEKIKIKASERARQKVKQNLQDEAKNDQDKVISDQDNKQ